MAVTRRCPSCERPSGPKFVACMYCGAALPIAGEAPASEGPSAEERAERARALLDGLSPKARALMPAATLARLEADAGREPTAIPTPPPPPPVRRGPGLAIADLPPANQKDGRGAFEASLLEALGRGGGPFGPRKAAWRLILQPSPSYRDNLPSLRDRLVHATGIDRYLATQYLQRPVPTCLASGRNHAAMRAASEELRAAGLVVELLARREWARDRLPQLVADIEDLDADPLVLRLAEGERTTLRREHLLTALLAEIAPVRETSSVETERNRIGLPVKHHRNALEDRFSPYIALDLLLAGRARPLRLRSSEFDFRRLGDDLEIAATLNMRTLVRRLSPRGQDLPVDDGFRRVPSLPGPNEREQAGGVAPGTLPRRSVDFAEYSLLRALALSPR